ncbi:MAG: Nif3-like dinuclear metal center hexameric protein [Nocardioidaceae bacterium]
MTTLREVVDAFHASYDPRWADAWDKVGLVTGDPDAEVSKVLFAIDPTLDVVEEAVAYGAQLLVVHHPLLLTPVSSVAATTPKGQVVHRLIGHGIGLLTAHTNADTPAHGVNEALARAVGIIDPQVIVATDDTALEKLVCFIPRSDAGRLRQVLADAGAGRIGDYDSASFTTFGEGRFRPLEGADPAIGQVGSLEVVDEARVEVVYPRAIREAALAAMRAVHPYEEPAYDVFGLVGQATATRGHGRIGPIADALTLREFAEQVARVLPKTAHGVRVAGDPTREVRTVAVAAGAGDSLLGHVAATRADVLVTSDLRHHRASEFLADGGPALVDVAHWAAEWTWLPVAQERLETGLVAAGVAAGTVESRVSTLVTDPWTFRTELDA